MGIKFWWGFQDCSLYVKSKFLRKKSFQTTNFVLSILDLVLKFLDLWSNFFGNVVRAAFKVWGGLFWGQSRFCRKNDFWYFRTLSVNFLDFWATLSWQCCENCIAPVESNICSEKEFANFFCIFHTLIAIPWDSWARIFRQVFQNFILIVQRKILGTNNFCF